MRQEGLRCQMSKMLSGCENPFLCGAAAHVARGICCWVRPRSSLFQDGLGTRLGWNWHPFSGNTLLVNSRYIYVVFEATE